VSICGGFPGFCCDFVNLVILQVLWFCVSGVFDVLVFVVFLGFGEFGVDIIWVFDSFCECVVAFDVCGRCWVRICEVLVFCGILV